MTNIQSYIDNLKQKAEDRFNAFKIVEINSIKEILDKAYIEKPTWLGGDSKFVCLFIDLDKSSKHSYKKHPKTMAQIYDYFTQNIVDVLNHPVIGADYIDIKGDGAFGIFDGDKASYKALYCAITFKTMFEQTISNKFSTSEEKLGCKFGIHKDKILVRRIGKRGEGNYNEVWAGRLVNNASKLASQAKKIPPDFNTSTPILISGEVYEDFRQHKEYGFYHCCNEGTGESILDKKMEMFTEFDELSDETLGDKFYYTKVRWCKNCADHYIELI
jgi:class 3 adenylate cyclase